MLLEWITRSIYKDLPSLRVSLGGDSSKPVLSEVLRPVNLHLACEAIDLLAVVLQVAHSNVD